MGVVAGVKTRPSARRRALRCAVAIPPHALCSPQSQRRRTLGARATAEPPTGQELETPKGQELEVGPGGGA